VKLKFQILIDAPRDAVWAAFDDPENLPRWQQNFRRRSHVSGEPGQPGAATDLVYGERGREVVLRETVTERAAPSFIAAVYDTPASKTLMVNHFESVDDRATRWNAWLNLHFRGFARLTAFFGARAIRERTETDMARFKLMVETDLANSGA